MLDIKIRSLKLSENPEIIQLLQSNNLPTEDISKTPIQFYGIIENNIILGLGALECYGSSAIVRSLAVQKEHQGLGYGKFIVSSLEKRAKEIGMKDLFLLTTTATTFFKKNGYQIIERKQCPSEISASSEFLFICPSSAICMKKSLS